MGNYVFAVMATALLLPLFFLVRMKFTSKGIWIIPLLSFLISVLGIFVLKSLTIWHSIIFMMLLLLLAALLLQRQNLFHTSSPKEGTTRYARSINPNNNIIETEKYEPKEIHRRKLVLEELSDQITEKK
ncbi:hypothetical protein ACQCT5_07775 [Sutcliffiella halmapala]